MSIRLKDQEDKEELLDHEVGANKKDTIGKMQMPEPTLKI